MHLSRTYRVIALCGALAGTASAGIAQDKPDAPTAKQSSAISGQYDTPAGTSESFELASDPTGEQDESPKPDAPTAKQSSASGQQSAPGGTQEPAGPPSNPTGQQDENPKRILGIIPNFQTKDDTPQNQPPLTVREKYNLAWHQTVDFSAHIGNAFQAMLQQASNGQPHYGQGWGPYAERFGAAEGDQATSAFFIFGFLPHILHDDPRYFRKGKGSAWSRIRYSATRTVITRTDTGNATFNIPQVAGQLFQQSISTIYYPPVDRTAGRVFQNWGVSLAYNSAYNVLKEFYPDFLRIVFKRKQQPPADGGSLPPGTAGGQH